MDMNEQEEFDSFSHNQFQLLLLKKCFKLIGNEGYSFLDLSLPEPKKIRKYLNQLIKFIQYKKEKKATFEESIEKYVLLK